MTGADDHSFNRSRIAHRARKYKKDVLRAGEDATALVTLIADGKRANFYSHTVYLELEVTRPGAEPYLVKTGEQLNGASFGSVHPGAELFVKVDPEDPQRVAVDWERTLRLPPE